MAGQTAISDTFASGSTSSLLVAGLRAGDAEAWRRFVRLYGPSVFRWCRRWPLSKEDVADVFQDVFATVNCTIGNFQRDGEGSFRGWLWTITRSRAADHLRRRQREPSAAGGTDAQQQMADIPDPLTDDAPPPIDCLTIHAAEALVKSEFEERTWLLFSRSVIDGQSTAQVAAELGVSPGAIRQARYRVLKRLRDELEGLA